jgi:hypothetical protein
LHSSSIEHFLCIVRIYKQYNVNCENPPHTEKEKIRGYLNLLPSLLTEKCAQLIAADVSGDHNAEVHRLWCQTDRWCFKYEPVKGFDVPHYVNLKLEEDYSNRVWVTLPGRQTPCSFCQQDSHWDSKCPTRTERQARRPTTDTLHQIAEIVHQPQETHETNECPRRPASKPRAPDDTTQKKKDIASSKRKLKRPSSRHPARDRSKETIRLLRENS